MGCRPQVAKTERLTRSKSDLRSDFELDKILHLRIYEIKVCPFDCTPVGGTFLCM